MPRVKNLKWHEARPGIWARDIDEVEEFYAVLGKLYQGSGRLFFAITGHLRLEIRVPGQLHDAAQESDVDRALRAAWISLRHAQPTIAAKVQYDSQTGRLVKEYRQVFGGWADETFVLISTGQNGVEWANSDPPAPALPTMFVVKPPEADGLVRRDIVLRSPHDIMDGIDTLLLLGKFVQLASDALISQDASHARRDAETDSQVLERLAPCFRVAARIPDVPSEAVQRQLARMAEPGTSDIETPAVMTMPYKHGKSLPGKHQRVSLTFSEDETAQLLACAKIHGATVTHVFHAALILAMRDLQERSDDDVPAVYDGYILQNERHRCAEPFNGPDYAASVIHSVSGQKLVVPVVVPGAQVTSTQSCGTGLAREEFLRILNTIRDFYHVVRDDGLHYLVAPYIWSASTPKLDFLLEPPPVPGPKLRPSVSISSMGNIDNIIAAEYGQIEVFDPWVTGEELGNGLGLFLGTFRKRLCLSAAYNDAWHDNQEVLAFLNKCKEIVRQGLDI